jgi:HK97 family phage portal protein
LAEWKIGPIAKAAWNVVTGSYLGERKFAPADPTVHWEYVNHLALTANTRPYDSNDGNSAVFACLRALSYASIEAPLQVVRTVDGDPEPLPKHPLQRFLEEPHPELDMEELRFWSAWARHLDGNAYLVKVRAGDSVLGQPVELWPVSPLRMEPFTARGSKNFIDYYTYDAGDGNGLQRIPVENVIQFKIGVDPLDPRKGISPLKALLREIATDAEASKFSSALLANFGIPGVVIKLPVEAQLSPQQISDLKEGTRREFGNEQRGKVGVITGGADMEQFGFSPEQLNLKSLHDFPETRIAAVMGVDPLVARLGVGLEQTSNYASARQVREQFIELTIKPQWTMDGKKWTRKLARDFTDDRTISIIHDLRQVAALQEDENAKHKRVDEDFKAGVISREEARTALGYDPEMATGDVVYTPTNVTYVEVGKELTDPEAERELDREAQAERMDALNNSQPAGALPAGGNKAFGTDDYSEFIQAVVDAAAPNFADDLEKLQSSQKRRVQRALVGTTNGSV